MLLPMRLMHQMVRLCGVLFAVGVMLITSRATAQTCARDDQCPHRTYCGGGRCRPIRRAINVLYLFYRSENRRFTEVAGIYWHHQGQTGYRVGFPLYWHFWSPGKQRRMVVPLYFDRQTEDERHLVIPPVELRRTRQAQGDDEQIVRVWPLVFYRRQAADRYRTMVLPLLYHSRSGDRRTLVFPPLLSYHSGNGSGDSRGMLAGLIHWKRHGAELGVGVLPLMWHKRSPRRRFTWVAPLTFQWSNLDPAARSFGLVVAPLMLHHHDARSSTTMALVPSLYVHHSRDRRRFYLPPLFLYHRTGERRLITLGPMWIRQAPDGAGFCVPPLFADWNKKRRWVVLYPVLWHHRTEERTTWVVGPGYYDRRRDGSQLDLGLVPLFGYARCGSRRLFLSVPLVYERNPTVERRQLLVGPLYYHLSDRWRQLDLAPPLFARHHDRASGATTWVGLGGALVRHRSSTHSATVVFPLLWSFRSPKRRDLGLLPAFWHHRRDRRQTTWVAPFNIYSRTDEPDGAHHRLILMGLMFAGWSPHRGHLFLPPLLWHWRSPTERAWVVVPGFHVRRPGRTDLGLAPLFFMHRTAHTHSVTLVPLFHHSVTPKRSRFLSLLFIYQKRADGRVQWGLTLPLYYRHRDARLSLDLMVPLFARWRDHQARSTTLVPGRCSSADTTIAAWRR